MKIQIGQVIMDRVTSQKMYPNKSKKYLLPCLKEYGEPFITKLKSVFKRAVGLGDIVVSNRGNRKKYEQHIFILVDTTIATRFFIDFLTWIKAQPMYEDDYIYGDITKSNYHMFILKFPSNYAHTFPVFWKGEYTTMFSMQDVKRFFSNHPNSFKVLTKDHDYRITFTKRLNRIFDSNLNPDELDELDLPPREEEEIFNHHLKKTI